MRRLVTIVCSVLALGLATRSVTATPLKDHRKSSRREAVRKTVGKARGGSRRKARTINLRKMRLPRTTSRKSHKIRAIQAAWMGKGLKEMDVRTVRGTGAEDPAELRITTAFVHNKGRLPWPVSGATVTHGFGSYRLMPGIQANNRGITLAAEPGTAVTAVAEGKVESVFPEVDAVIIRHGKYFTVYSDLSDISVHPGDDICEGDLLGRVGDSRQIDFWLSDDQVRYEDPIRWLKK